MQSILTFVLLLSVVDIVVGLPLDNNDDSDYLGKSDEVTSLPGLHFKLHYRHFSGYLESVNQSRLHYWFFESAHKPASDPVVLWLNGGPGCSSLLGALTELGPIHVDEQGRVVRNAYGWNDRANVIFLESPAGVGFSYNEARHYATDDKRTAELNYEAVRSFFRKFPHYAKHDFYVAGESYGGVYVPTLSAKLVEHDYPEKFVGFAIGNGYLDQTLLGNSFLLFTYYHGLYDTDLWEKMRTECCPDVDDIEKCDFVNNKHSHCKKAIEAVRHKLDESKINWYNIYGRCDQSKQTNNSRSLTPYQMNKRFVTENLLKLDQYQTVEDEIPCLNYDYLERYLNRSDVRHALHINHDSAVWAPCSNIDYTNQYKSLTKVVRKLLQSGLKGLIYNGDVDTVCNYLGDQWFAQGLGYKTVREYTPWQFEGQVAGYVKVYERFAFTTIRGSGHMVPQDKSGPALKMFNKFLES